MAIDWGKWLPIAAKAAGSAAKYYIDYKDQKRKNEVTEAAYRQYAAEVADAKAEAQAAIDVNLTPMEITNIPQTKADVSSFTAVAARGGLMNLPTRQRKRYASQGFVEDDIEIMEPESLGDFELQMEEGVNIGEQVFHDTGDDRTNAQQVWQSGQIDQGLYQMDFEIFFKSGDWQDHISRGTVQGDTQMASRPEDFMTNEEMAVPNEEIQSMISTGQQVANGGIIGLRYGGRPGYQFGVGPQQGMMPQGMMPQGMMPQGMMPQGMMPQQGLMPPQGLRPGYAEQGWVTKNSTEEEEQLPRMGQQAAPEKLDWFQDLYLDREGGGGKDFIVPEKYKNLLDDDDERFDEWNRLESKKETFEGGAGKNLMNKAIRIMDKAYDLDEELHAQINNEFLEIVNSGDAEPGEAYYYIIKKYGDILEMKKGGRVKRDNGGIMNLGGLEKDYRTTGGFVPLGGRERADDVPARLSKNEFVMTADAVRAAGGGSINRGAQRMYDTMKHLEASPQSNRMTA